MHNCHKIAAKSLKLPLNIFVAFMEIMVKQNTCILVIQFDQFY